MGRHAYYIFVKLVKLFFYFGRGVGFVTLLWWGICPGV